MNSPTVRKISFGCLGIIIVMFIGLIVLLTVLPDDVDSEPAASPEETSTPFTPSEPEEGSLAATVRDRFYEDLVEEVDGEEIFDNPGGIGEDYDYEVPILEWSNSENDYEIIVTAVEGAQGSSSVSLCQNVLAYGTPRQPESLNGEDGRLDLRYVILQDVDGNDMAQCDAIDVRTQNCEASNITGSGCEGLPTRD